jgi:hypothetical protein
MAVASGVRRIDSGGDGMQAHETAWAGNLPTLPDTHR